VGDNGASVTRENKIQEDSWEGTTERENFDLKTGPERGERLAILGGVTRQDTLGTAREEGENDLAYGEKNRVDNHFCRRTALGEPWKKDITPIMSEGRRVKVIKSRARKKYFRENGFGLHNSGRKKKEKKVSRHANPRALLTVTAGVMEDEA